MRTITLLLALLILSPACHAEDNSQDDVMADEAAAGEAQAYGDTDTAQMWTTQAVLDEPN